MKDKYEISLWEDYLVSASDNIPAHYEERKLCVIGSDSMTSLCRAEEPKLVQNINGTNTFTFKMRYIYNDKGEEYSNPFLPYLVNERKIKVFWKDEWYDLVIKDCNEDSSSKSITYTCKDLYINELSKTGFNLEFDTELENNQGTIEELGSRILEGTDWQIDSTDSDIVFQQNEEAVYEATALTGFDALGVNFATGAETTVHVTAGDSVLIFYSTYVNKDPFLQFWTAGGDTFQTDGSDMVVLNGQCLGVEGGSWVHDSNTYSYVKNALPLMRIPDGTSVSIRYRAKKLVRSQLQVIDPLTEKYCSVYTNSGTPETLYHSFFETEYSDVSVVTNCITNSSNFSSTTGWSGSGLCFKMYPEYVPGTAYVAKGYFGIKVNSTVYNSGIKDFRSYIPKGFSKGEQYIFRVKSMTDSANKPSGTYCTTANTTMRPFIGTYTYNESTKAYTKSGSSYFTVGTAVQNGDWVEFPLTCNTSASYDQLLNLGFFLDNTSVKAWIEEVQFFKYVEGTPVIQSGYDADITYSEDDTILYNDVYYRCIRETKGNAPSNTTYWTNLGSTEPTSIRINPGSYSAQSYANEVWRLFQAGQNVSSVDKLVYAYSGTEAGLKSYISANNLSPKYGPNGKYEKVRSITGKQSNRFNLLQTLAETFEVWIKFTINHDATGRTIYTNGVPEKYVSFVNEVGGRNGLSFRYGIDLKGVTRTINSDTITSKVIVPANNNKYGKNGFCTIARAKENYPKTTFILNFDYYISQGLLSRQQIQNDLYSTDSQYIGYYYYLNIYNTELEKISEEMTKKKNEIMKLNAKKTVIDSMIAETEERITAIEDDLAHYAGYNCFCEGEVKAYLDGRGKNDDVAWSAWYVRISLINNLSVYASQKYNIDITIAALESRILVLETQQRYFLGLIADLDAAFYAKYSRFIQEGSWTSDNYYDDDLYYFDALSTAYTSSRPQISYNISVIRVSSLPEFKNKVFNLGDISYVIDTEFFGYEDDGITPYKEEVVISEITSNFDSPQNDEIKVQNYKTQFEDLFQRIAATTQTLQFTTGAYNNTVNNFTTTGEIKDDVLQRSLASNPDLTWTGDNDSVIISKDGIIVSDPNNPAKMMKITATGIQFSQDKGATWSTAITGNGILPQSLTTGLLETDKVNVTSGTFPTFRWDQYGLTAFSFDRDPDRENAITNIQGKKFVRFDQYGLYGVDKTDDASFPEDWSASDASDIETAANFGFTWEGFFIKSASDSGYVKISSENDIQVISTATGSDVERIKIGNLAASSSDPAKYGMRINDGDGNTVLETGDDGNLWLRNELHIGDSSMDVSIGQATATDSIVINANDSFIVYQDGSVLARSIVISGGEITAQFDGNLDGGSWD